MKVDISSINLYPKDTNGFYYKRKYYSNIKDALEGKHLKQEVLDQIENYKIIQSELKGVNQRRVHSSDVGYGASWSESSGMSHGVSCSSSSGTSTGISSSIGYSIGDKDDLLHSDMEKELFNSLKIMNNLNELDDLFEDNINELEDIVQIYLDSIIIPIPFLRANEFFSSQDIIIHDVNITQEYCNIINRIQKNILSKNTFKLEEISKLESAYTFLKNNYSNAMYFYREEGKEEKRTKDLTKLDFSKKYSYILYVLSDISIYDCKAKDKFRKLLKDLTDIQILCFDNTFSFEEKKFKSQNKLKKEYIVEDKSIFGYIKDKCYEKPVILLEGLDNKLVNKEILLKDYQSEVLINREFVNFDKSFCNDKTAYLEFTTGNYIYWCII